MQQILQGFMRGRDVQSFMGATDTGYRVDQPSYVSEKSKNKKQKPVHDQQKKSNLI